MLWSSIIKKNNHFIKIVLSYISFEFSFINVLQLIVLIILLFSILSFSLFL